MIFFLVKLLDFSASASVGLARVQKDDGSYLDVFFKGPDSFTTIDKPIGKTKVGGVNYCYYKKDDVLKSESSGYRRAAEYIGAGSKVLSYKGTLSDKFVQLTENFDNTGVCIKVTSCKYDGTQMSNVGEIYILSNYSRLQTEASNNSGRVLQGKGVTRGSNYWVSYEAHFPASLFTSNACETNSTDATTTPNTCWQDKISCWRGMMINEVRNSLITNGKGLWLNTKAGGIAHRSCINAFTENGENTNNAEKYCKDYLCTNPTGIKIRDLLKQESVRDPSLTTNGFIDADEVSTGYCAGRAPADPLDKNENSNIEDNEKDGCLFYDNTSSSLFLSECRFDAKPDTNTTDNCDNDANAASNIKTSVGYKYFCSNKQISSLVSRESQKQLVKCKVTGSFNPTKYSDVFNGDRTSINSRAQSYCEFSDNLRNTCSTSVTDCNLRHTSSSLDTTSCCYGTSPTENCGVKNFSIASNEITTQSLYCSKDNKIVKCGVGLNNLPRKYRATGVPTGFGGTLDDYSVFKSGDFLEANKITSCTSVSPISSPPLSPICNLAETSTCQFGDKSSGSNCWDTTTTRNFLDPRTNNRFKLFCGGDNKTIICQDEVATYNEAFPSAGGASGTNWTPDNTRCQEFTGSGFTPTTGTCDLPDKGTIYINYGGTYYNLLNGDANIGGRVITFNSARASFISCMQTTQDQGRCFRSVFASGVSNRNFFRCECSTSYNPQYNFIACSVTGGNNLPGVNCDIKCLMINTSFANYQQPNKQESFNPITLIKTLSDFLFSLAVIIFIINMLRASFMYVTSSGDEGKMKEAYTTITNTIFGFVFIVFIGALIQYFIALATKVVGS